MGRLLAENFRLGVHNPTRTNRDERAENLQYRWRHR